VVSPSLECHHTYYPPNNLHIHSNKFAYSYFNLQAYRAQVQFRASKLWLRRKMMILSVPPKITGPSSSNDMVSFIQLYSCCVTAFCLSGHIPVHRACVIIIHISIPGTIYRVTFSTLPTYSFHYHVTSCTTPTSSCILLSRCRSFHLIPVVFSVSSWEGPIWDFPLYIGHSFSRVL